MQHCGKKLFHSSIRLSGAKTVYLDPWHIEGEPHDADLILVTHDHHDHYSPEDIQKLMKPGTQVVVPASMEAMVSEAQTVEPGKQYQFCGILVETVSAYNVGRPFHPQEKRYVGYIVTLDGLRYYIAGDTDCIPENRAVSCDVAFVPVGGKYTMDAVGAAELVNCIHPAVAIPTHYGTVTDSSDAAEGFAALVSKDITVEIQ